MRLFLSIVIAIGVTLIFDARHLSGRYFSDSDKNKVVNVIKSVGFVLVVVGVVLVTTIYKIF
jgi:hypothetical protein